MAIDVRLARSKGEFKDLILDNLFVITRNAASLFDNLHRTNTNDFADDLAHCFELLIARIDREDALEVPEAIWHVYMLLWQAANSLIAAYQSIRVGFPVEAVVIERHSLELQALALQLFLDPRKFEEFKAGKLQASKCVSAAKKVFPDFGQKYGLLSKIAHPTSGLLGTYLQRQANGQVIMLIGAGIPGQEPRFVRSALTQMLVGVIEMESALLHASTELMALDVVTEPQYWQRNDTGIVWSPSKSVKKRWTDRTDTLLKLLAEIQRP